jgi:hypothetical protein
VTRSLTARRTPPGILARIIPAALAFALISSAAAAAEITLPGNGFFPGWQVSEKPRTFVKADLFNHIDGGAELFLEFGFERVTVQRYAKGKAEINLETYEMGGPDSALGVYLMKCGKETPLPGIPARNSSETAQFTILKGRYFVLIDNPDGDKALVPAMTALAAAFLVKIPDQAADPRLFASLPREKRLGGSERLLRGPVGLQPYYTFGEGDILGLGGKVFGALASYEEPQGQASMRLAVIYPSAAEALAIFRGLKANLDPYLKILETKGTAFSFVDFRERYGLVSLSGSKLDLAFNLPVRPRL